MTRCSSWFFYELLISQFFRQKLHFVLTLVQKSNLNSVVNFIRMQQIVFLCVCMCICCSYAHTLCAHLAHTENCFALKTRVLLSQLIPKDKSNLLLSCKTFFFQKHRLLYFYCESLWQWQGNQCWPSFRLWNDNTRGE